MISNLSSQSTASGNKNRYAGSLPALQSKVNPSQVTPSNARVQNFGSTAFMAIGDSGLQPIGLQIANASGGTLTYYIGDPNGLCRAVLAAAASPTIFTSVTTSALTSAVFNASLLTNPLVITGIQYSVTSTAQFNQAFNYYQAKQDGTGQPTPLAGQIAQARNNQQYISTLLDLDFSATPLVLNSQSAIFVTVLNGQTVDLTINVAYSAGVQ